jgi:hypothetical protein
MAATLVHVSHAAIRFQLMEMRLTSSSVCNRQGVGRLSTDAKRASPTVKYHRSCVAAELAGSQPQTDGARLTLVAARP